MSILTRHTHIIQLFDKSSFSARLIMLLLCLGGCVSILKCSGQTAKESSNAKQVIPIRGMTLVAPPNPFPKDPFLEMRPIGINWIAVNPYAMLRPEQAELIYAPERQWWGERPEGIRQSIQLAKQQGIRIMLKPQVWSWETWTGELTFSTEADWQKWESGYKSYILQMAELAQEQEAEMFCIGTEFKLFVQQRPQFWEQLIAEVRSIYDGSLTYAANWDAYQAVPFWHLLDYIGIDAYFPLSPATTPTVAALQESWQPYKSAIEQIAKSSQKPVIFTEFGYLSVDGCAYNTWELEKRLEETPENQQAQANAVEALLHTFAIADWWQGGFQWKWYPNQLGNDGEGQFSKDYTPQNKACLKVLQKIYVPEKE